MAEYAKRPEVTVQTMVRVIDDGDAIVLVLLSVILCIRALRTGRWTFASIAG